MPTIETVAMCDRCQQPLTQTYWAGMNDPQWEKLCNTCHKVWRDKQDAAGLPCGSVAFHATPGSQAGYVERGQQIGELVESKQKQYGRAAEKAGGILAILYPDGVQPHQYTDMLIVVRILDKCSRIAQRGADGKDLGGESPYRDIAGYSLLGLGERRSE